MPFSSVPSPSKLTATWLWAPSWSLLDVARVSIGVAEVLRGARTRSQIELCCLLVAFEVFFVWSCRVIL